MIKQEVIEHILLHLQSIRRHLPSAHQDIPEDMKQVEFDMYEIGAHLGLSPKEINYDIRHNITK